MVQSNIANAWLGSNDLLFIDIRRVIDDAHLLSETANISEALQTVTTLAQQGILLSPTYYRIVDKKELKESIKSEVK